MPLEFDPARIVARVQGREGWLREGKRQLERHRWQHPDPIPRARPDRLLLAAERLEAELEVERRANAAYEHYRATARDKLGRRLSRGPNPYQPPEVPAGRVNLTDPDSKSLPISFGFAQGYNAQAAVNEQRIVLAAEITNTSTDFSQLDPMVTATLNELERIGVSELPEAIVADAGYWNEQHIDEVVANKHIPVLIPPDKMSRGTPRSTWSGGRYDWMRKVLATELGRADLPKTQTDGRARIRPHQTQQWRHPLQPTRPGQGAHRVAITDDDPEPRQGLPPPTRRHRGLKQGPTQPHRRPGRTQLTPTQPTGIATPAESATFARRPQPKGGARQVPSPGLLLGARRLVAGPTAPWTRWRTRTQHTAKHCCL